LKEKSAPISKVLLVEVAGSHDECLYTQMEALREESIDFLLAVDAKVAARILAPEDRIRVLRSGDESSWKVGSNLLNLIRDYQPDRVVFNTAQGSIIRNVALRSLFSKTEFIGLIHTNRKFQGSFTQALISLKIKKYLFLAQFLHETIHAAKGIQTTFFYPLDFPGGQAEIHREPQGRLVIVGGVESRRKDLDGFLILLEQLPAHEWHFTFLGKSDNNSDEVAKFKRKLLEIGRESQVRLFDDFVSHQDFAAVMNTADFVLPLIHPNTPSADQYFKNQIPGAMNVALAWKKPLLVHTHFSGISELAPAAFYYELSDFKERICAIDQLRYASKVQEMKERESYTSNYNRKAFIRFLKNGSN
jgi:hypothetical protein